MFSYSNMKLTFSWMVLGLVSRFPIGVENMEGAVALQNLMGALKSIHGWTMGNLKCCRKISVKEFI